MTTKKQKKPTRPTSTMTDLRNHLLETFDDVRNNAVPLDKAKEISSLAGKVINSAKVQVEYAVARKEKPRVPFML